MVEDIFKGKEGSEDRSDCTMVSELGHGSSRTEKTPEEDEVVVGFDLQVAAWLAMVLMSFTMSWTEGLTSFVNGICWIRKDR